VIVFSIFGFGAHAKAILAPRIHVFNLKISEANENQIKGEFVVVNEEDYYLSDLNYEIKLIKGVSYKDFKLIDVNVPKEIFFVPPHNPVNKSFTYTYPKNIVSGEYTLRAQVITERGDELGWSDQTVSLTGENKFLDIFHESAKVLVNNKDFSISEGVNVSPNDEVSISFNVGNPGDAITVTPHVKVFKRQFNMPLVKEYSDSQITFTSGETKEISLVMPKFGDPESYLAEIKFYQDDQQVSGIQYARWVVRGDGGKILYVKTNKDYYKAGENVEIIIDSIGPADFSDLGMGKLEVRVSDKNGSTIGRASKEVAINSDLVSTTVTVPTKVDLVLPIINAKLVKDGKTLDERNVKLSVFSEEAQQIEKEVVKKESTTKLTVYVLSLVMLFVVGFLLYKFKSRKS